MAKMRQGDARTVVRAFGRETELGDEDKRALIAFLKTF